jgi:hypothetical protein
MSEKQETIPQNAGIIAMVGDKSTEPILTLDTLDNLKALTNGITKGITLENSVIIFYNDTIQGETIINPQNLSGTLVICGVDGRNNPTSLTSLKQITKYAKLLRKPRTEKTNVETDDKQTNLHENMGDK